MRHPQTFFKIGISKKINRYLVNLLLTIIDRHVEVRETHTPRVLAWPDKLSDKLADKLSEKLADKLLDKLADMTWKISHI